LEEGEEEGDQEDGEEEEEEEGEVEEEDQEEKVYMNGDSEIDLGMMRRRKGLMKRS